MAVEQGTTESSQPKTTKYSIFVLALLLLAYLLNQLDRYMLAITVKPMAQDIRFGDRSCMDNNTQSSDGCVTCNAANVSSCENIIDSNQTGVCKWDFDGQGLQYQIVAGPVFTVVFTVTGIVIGFAGDRLNRKILLSGCIIFWSVMTVLTGLINSYWQLVLLRFGLGMGEAGCTPFATAIIADLFPRENRGLALGFYNWGIYTGYSLSYALGNFITTTDILGFGWRWSFFLSGAPGLFLGVVILFAIKEPSKADKLSENSPNSNRKPRSQSNYSKLEEETTFASSCNQVSEGLPWHTHVSNRPLPVGELPAHAHHNSAQNRPWQTHASNLPLPVGKLLERVHGAQTIPSFTGNDIPASHLSQKDGDHFLNKEISENNSTKESSSSKTSSEWRSRYVKLFMGTHEDQSHYNVHSWDKQQSYESVQCVCTAPKERDIDSGRLPKCSDNEKSASGKLNILDMLRPFLKPALCFLVIAGSVRNAAGYVWSYNTQPFFIAIDQPPKEIGLFMSWIPLVGGSIGVVLGGFISDRIVQKWGVYARVAVVTLSQLLAAPFAAATLKVDPPAGYFFQIPAYIIGEMWVAVTLTVVLELVPSRVRTAAVAIYLFITTNIGGTVPLVLPIIQRAFQSNGYSKTDALKGALYILYPGLFLLGAVLFLVTTLLLKRSHRRVDVVDAEIMEVEIEAKRSENA